LENPEAADEVLETKPKTQAKAQRIAKVVNLIVSVGDDDRARDFEKFLADIKKSLGAVEPPFIDKKTGKRLPGTHVAMTGGYYILDGKVCLPEDYDRRKQTFRTGAYPPPWAGGPKHSTVKVGIAQKQMDWDLENLSSDEYDKKYRIGKYAPPQESEQEHRERMRRQRAEAKKQRELQEEAELEEFEWDEDDLADDKKLGAAADESASAAIKKLKSGKKVVVKKKAATPAKKVVRRVKK
jgi:hypothetical protein